ncbi:MAG: hypothetical protein JEY99_01890 [Spirochaetales bacterium]|nr:hypothetical protein [Spirochaetales bacterium]
MNDDNNLYGGSIDSDIADLMGIDPSASQTSTPDFGDLFESNNSNVQDETPNDEVDFSKTSFVLPSRIESDTPNKDFLDKEFYKKVLSNEGEVSQRLHKLLTQFINAQDPKDKSLYRGKIISAYWNLMTSVASKVGPGFSGPKQTAFRLGYLLPNIISPEQRKTLSKIIVEHDEAEPFYYMDEWLRKVGSGQVNPSATDETKPSAKKDNSKIQAQLDKARGGREIHMGTIRNKMGTLESCENMVMEKLKILHHHNQHPQFPELKEGYDAPQRQVLSEVSNLMREMSTIDKDITRGYLELERIDENYRSLQLKAKELGVETRVDAKVLLNEINTLRQLAKMSVGRQGNHFPILMKQYFRPNIREWGTRENITIEFAAVEAIDPGVFKRTFKRQTNRIIPYVIILPCYGERGVCWEPFEKFNRATSRGRIGIPLYPKNLKEAIIMALGDLRWQVAKEKAQHYWMEEGLTGRYYDYFTERRMKGDIKESFVQDYYLWITKESEGTQKLEKEARSVFWRYVPFPDPIRENLKNRGFVYSELYKKDSNRAKSDGY